MGKPKIKPHNKPGFLKENLASRASKADLQAEDCFKITFKHLDRNQGQTHHEWQAGGMLGKAVETLASCCSAPIRSQLGTKFTIYGSFPPPERTEFTHPRHVPEDAEWARIHVNGKHCLIGHIVRDTFYVVFFDKEHKFWKSELKHT